MCTNFSLSKKFPESLTRFKKGTKKDIVKWYKTARENDKSMDNFEADDLYIDTILIIIVWNDDALTTRNIQKNTMTAGMSENNKNHSSQISNYILVSYSRI